MSNDQNIDLTIQQIRERIKNLRIEKKFSGYALGLSSDISSSVIARIEKGKREPRLSTLLKIIEGLEITPAEFFKIFNERHEY
ncbi:MAG: helix-turn-helix transcriptional regulator [Candidatus Margulisiibacteriota bacterium]|jgi:transcriptional regulator with XRE-family HTH domain